jgi:hypothetical protein
MHEDEEGAAFFEPVPLELPSVLEQQLSGSLPPTPYLGRLGQDALPEVVVTEVPVAVEEHHGLDVWGILSVAGAAAGAYHGYRRNRSIGWALVWALCGSIAPIITVPVALAQGYGKKK